MVMRTAATIKRVCALVLSNEGYEMDNSGRTWCNYALNDALTQLGLPEFCRDNKRLLLANDIVEKLERNCKKIAFGDAGEAANKGDILVAGMKLPLHGHVAMIYPSPTSAISGKWGRADIPFCANVGKENGVMPLNWAFGAIPNIYVVQKNEYLKTSAF